MPMPASFWVGRSFDLPAPYMFHFSMMAFALSILKLVGLAGSGFSFGTLVNDGHATGRTSGCQVISFSTVAINGTGGDAGGAAVVGAALAWPAAAGLLLTCFEGTT